MVRGKPLVVSVMQPYLYPYAGYFRLFAAADVFIVLDDVQFTRRGRVHRCQLPDAGGGGGNWLTLPLVKQPRETSIRDLIFHSDARAMLDARLARLDWFRRGAGPLAERVREQFGGPLDAPATFVEDGLRLVAEALELPARVLRSSSLPVDRTLAGADYVMALVRAVGGGRYLNSPGGRHLYEVPAFADAGLELRFLDAYEGPYTHLLPALLQANPADLRADIVRSCHGAD